MNTLDETLDTFKEETEDLWEQFMEGDDPDPQKYDEFLDNAYKQAKASLIEYIDTQTKLARIEAKKEVLEYMLQFTKSGAIVDWDFIDGYYSTDPELSDTSNEEKG